MGFRRIAITATLVALLGTFVAPAGAADGPRGTGRASTTALSIDIEDPDLKLDLVALQSLATRDAGNVDDAGVDLARGTLTPASTVVDLDVLNEILKLQVERTADDPGEDSRSLTGQVLSLPGTLAREDLGVDRTSMKRLINPLDGAADVDAPDVDAEVDIGSLLQAGLPSDELVADFATDSSRAAFTGGAGVDDLSVLGGLVALDDFNVPEQESWSEVEQAGGAVRAVSLDRLVVLDLEGFLRLIGLSFADLSLANLTELAAGLGLDPTGTLGGLDVDEYETWDAVRGDLNETRDQLQSLENAGATTCDTLTDPIGDLLAGAGVVCDSVEEALADVNELLDLLLDAVEGVLSGAALLSVEDVAGEVQAVAQVDADAVANTSATAVGRVGAVKVGDVTIGSIEADLSKTSLSALDTAIQGLAGGVNTKLDEVLGTLGEAYRGLIDVLPIANLEQTTGIDGRYAVAEAALTLLRVRVSLPEILDEVTDLTEGGTGGGGSTTSTTTTTLLPVPTTLPTLPIASVRPAGEPLGQVAPLGSTVTVDVGALSASANHTRDIEITNGGDNRTFDERTGFGGPTPRTGAGTAALLLFAAVLVGAGWLGRRALVRAAERV